MLRSFFPCLKKERKKPPKRAIQLPFSRSCCSSCIFFFFCETGAGGQSQVRGHGPGQAYRVGRHRDYPRPAGGDGLRDHQVHARRARCGGHATAATSTCVTAAAAALRSDGTAPAGTADFARRCSRPPPSYRSHPATSARRALTSPRLRSGKVGMWSRRRGRSTSRRSRARRSSRRSSTFTTSSATPTRPVRLSTQLPSRTASGDPPRCLPLPPPPRPLSPPRRPRLCSQPHPPRVQNRARVGTGAADGCKLPRYMNMTSKPLRAHPAGRGPCSRCVEMPEGSRLS